MKIAVSYDNGLVAEHFGKTRQFKIITAKKGKIISEEMIECHEKGHDALAEFLGDNDVDVLICGGIGAGAKKALAQQCIVFFAGVVGEVKYQIEDFMKGELSFNPFVSCGHNDDDDESNEDE